MQGLVERGTKYDYLDALVVMPVYKLTRLPLILHRETPDTTNPKRVFCSQSVALMLRECLDKDGLHKVCTIHWETC